MKSYYLTCISIINNFTSVQCSVLVASNYNTFLLRPRRITIYLINTTIKSTARKGCITTVYSGCILGWSGYDILSLKHTAKWLSKMSHLGTSVIAVLNLTEQWLELSCEMLVYGYANQQLVLYNQTLSLDHMHSALILIQGSGKTREFPLS